MGIFINDEEHPNVFKNGKGISEPNQRIFKINELAEFFQSQKIANETLLKSVAELEKRLLRNDVHDTHRWEKTRAELNRIKTDNKMQREFQRKVQEQLAELADRYGKMEEAFIVEEDYKRGLENQLLEIRQNQNRMTEMMGRYENQIRELQHEIERIAEGQRKLEEQMGDQKEVQREVIQRIDNQEALTEVLLRQIQHIRSVIYERTNDLAERLETGLKRLTSYIHHLFTPSDQPTNVYQIPSKKAKGE